MAVLDRVKSSSVFRLLLVVSLLFGTTSIVPLVGQTVTVDSSSPPVVVNSVSDLDVVTPQNGRIVIIRTGDAAGVFYYDKTSSTTVDDIDVIAGPGSVGRFLRLAGGSGGAVAEGARVNKVANVEALFDIVSVSDNDLYQTLGYSTEGIGANLYRYDASSTATIDGGFVMPGPGGTLSFSGTTFNGTTGTGRFIAVNQTVADVTKFGAVSDSVATEAIQRAIDSCTNIVIENGMLFRVVGLDVTTSGTIISGEGTLKAESTAADVITLTADGCTVTGITIDGNASSIAAVKVGIKAIGDYALISKCRFTSTHFAVLLTGDFSRVSDCSFVDFDDMQVNVNASHCVVTASTFNDSGRWLDANTSHVINLESNYSGSPCSHNIISHNNIYANGTPIQLTATSTGVCSYNHIVQNHLTYTGTVNSGLKINGADSNKIEDNQINSSNYGMVISGADANKIRGNWSISTKGFSIGTSIGTEIVGNTIESTSSYYCIGISSGSDSTYIRDNKLLTCLDSINCEAGGGERHQIEGNEIVAASRYAIRLDTDGHFIDDNYIHDCTGATYGSYLVGNDLKVTRNRWSSNVLDSFRYGGASTGLHVEVSSLSEVVNLPVNTNVVIVAGQRVCTGTPESSVTANVGTSITRTDGGANTTLYIKESGSGNTGWVAK